VTAEAPISLWDFCNASQLFWPDRPASRILCFDVAGVQQDRGVRMSIETLILILILTLAAGFALNWWDAKRNL
jgi:hypothetical protein